MRKILTSYNFNNLEQYNFRLENVNSIPTVVEGKLIYYSITKKLLIGGDTTFYDPTDRATHTGVQSISSISGLQTALDEKQTATQVNDAIQAVVGAAPAALDTLKEIADKLAADDSAIENLLSLLTGVPHKYPTTIGGLSSHIVTHNLNTLDVTVTIYEIATGATVECDITRDTVNQITLDFVGTPPPANSLRVIVIG